MNTRQILKRYQVQSDQDVLAWIAENRTGVASPPPGVRALLTWKNGSFEGFPEEIVGKMHNLQVSKTTIRPRTVMWSFDPCVKVVSARVGKTTVGKWLALNTLASPLKYLLERRLAGLGVPARLCARMLEIPASEVVYPRKAYPWTMKVRQYNGGLYIWPEMDIVIAFTGLKVEQPLQRLTAALAPDFGYILKDGMLTEIPSE